MPSHVFIACPCGRTLRATKEQFGTQIRCWECHRPHIVPAPPTGALLAPACLDGAQEFLGVKSLFLFLAGGLAISTALAIPYAGPALGFALLTAAAGLYPEVIRSSGRGGDPAPPVPARRVWLERGAWGTVLALGSAAPVLLRHVVMDGYGRLLSWRGPGVAAVAVACWLAFPLAALLGTARDAAGPVPARTVLTAIRRHPLATIVALLIPLGLLALEAALVAASGVLGWFDYLVMDLFPDPGSVRVVPGVGNDPEEDPALLPLSFYKGVYLHGLKLGYTLLGAVPASLPRGPTFRARPWFPLTSAWNYLAVRVFYSALILAGVGVLLALQARWLGLIATVDPRPPVGAGEREGS